MAMTLRMVMIMVAVDVDEGEHGDDAGDADTEYADANENCVDDGKGNLGLVILE